MAEVSDLVELAHEWNDLADKHAEHARRALPAHAVDQVTANTLRRCARDLSDFIGLPTTEAPS